MNKDSNIPNFGDGLKKNPFSAPNGYFDHLPSRIQDKCVEPEPNKSWIKAFIPQLGFAVGFIALVLLAKGFFNIVGQTPMKPQDAMVQTTDSTMYYDDNGEVLFIDDVAIDDAIISYLVDNNINDIDIAQ